MKFNPDLIQKARKGEIAILNDGSVDELREVLMAVWPEDHVSDQAGGVEKYYFAIRHTGQWTADSQTNLPTHSIKDFFMPENILTGPQAGKCTHNQPRTYKVTRQQMKEIWEAAPIIARQSVRQDAEKMFSVFENEAEITGGDVAVIVKYFFEPYPDLLKSIFPEYFFIPEGEPVLCRDDDREEFVIRISAGKGEVYDEGYLSNQAGIQTYKKIIPFTKNPPK